MKAPRRDILRSPETIEAILDRAGESRFARVRPPVAPRLWREVVGARIADRAVPVSLHGGVLLLRVATSVWAHELSFLSDEVCKRLRAGGVHAQQLRSFVGAIPAAERPPERRLTRAVPPSGPLPSEVAAALEALPDARLREAIGAAAQRNLAWQAATTKPDGLRLNEGARAARAPRPVEVRSVPLDQTSLACREGSPDSPSVPPYRSH
jgi:hypothetical protein